VPKRISRPDKAFRIGTLAELGSMTYSISWSGIAADGWAESEISGWPPCVQTVMLFFASGHRSSRPFKSGARGWSVPLTALAKAVRRVTGRKCGLSTLKAGLRWALDNDLLTVSHAADPDREFETRPGVKVKLKGSRRKQIGPGKWITLRRAIYCLTEKATALWSTPLNGADSSGFQKSKSGSDGTDDQGFIFKKPMIGATSSQTDKRQSKLGDPVTSSCVRTDKGTESGPARSSRCPTRPPAATLEHESIDSATGAETQTALKRGSSSRSKPTGVPRGLSCKPPTAPRGNWSNSWNNGRSAFLASVAAALVDVPRTDADRIFERVRFETWTDRDRSIPVSGPWDELIGRWKFTGRRERLRLIRVHVLPVLRSKPPLPSDRPVKVERFETVVDEVSELGHNARIAGRPGVAAMAAAALDDLQGGGKNEQDTTEEGQNLSELETESPPSSTADCGELDNKTLETADRLGFGDSVRSIVQRFGLSVVRFADS